MLSWRRTYCICGLKKRTVPTFNSQLSSFQKTHFIRLLLYAREPSFGQFSNQNFCKRVCSCWSADIMFFTTITGFVVLLWCQRLFLLKRRCITDNEKSFLLHYVSFFSLSVVKQAEDVLQVDVNQTDNRRSTCHCLLSTPENMQEDDLKLYLWLVKIS